MALLFNIEIDFSITSIKEKSIFSNVIFRFSSFAKSKMSFTRKSILLALLFKAFKCSFCYESSLVLSKISEADITADRGVLISCCLLYTSDAADE